MFEFFLALFGGLYYTGRYFGDKEKVANRHIEIDQQIRELKSDDELWRKKVIDEKFEYETKLVNYNTFNEMKNRIIREANVQTVSYDMVIMGLLAQKAKIPRSITYSGIPSRGIWDYEEKLKWHEQRKFMLWYDKELRSHGLDSPLLFVDGSNRHQVKHNIEVAHPITRYEKVIGGLYFWAPMRYNIV